MMARVLLVIPAVLALAFLGCATGGADDGSSGHAGSSPDGSAGSSGDGGSAGASGSGGSGASNGGSSGDAGWLDDVCFLHDCSTDADCVGCPNDRVKCETSSKRCVVCLPSDPPGVCGAGKVCSPYGTCIPETATCPVDANGVPTVSCTSDNDCFACDPDHQVCDTTTQKCVTCTDTNKYACDPTDSCKNNVCAPKCPSPCTSDADCSNCGTLANPGNACNQNTHHCGECSDTVPCKNDTVCGPQGMCIKVCGAANQPKGTCSSDADCSGCQGDAIACHLPINGGVGKCGLPASGCSDIGSFTALPDPWGSVTQTCSNDSDCSGVGVNLNVGKILRDLTGLDQVNDATLQYGMNVCASVTVGLAGQSYSCGVCVPCRQDSDCEPIQFDPLIDQAFGPVGGAAAKALIKMVWGDAPHELQMYCEPVLGDFGVCAPCLDFLHECAVASTAGSGCNSDWDCAAGERCTDGKCVAYQGSCNTESGQCTGGNVCAWNGTDYCCRAPFTGTKSCFTDAECAPDVCASNGTGYFCTPPVACNP